MKKMKILIINGYPGKKGLTSELSKVYYKFSKKAGNNVKLLTLYDLKFDLILHEGYKGKQKIEPDLKKSQELISWAEHIVLFYPIWWGSMPALVKGFIDRTLIPEYAFIHEDGKFKKLLKGRTISIIATAGGPQFVYSLLSKTYYYLSSSLIFGFCGIKVKKVKIFGGIFPKANPKKIQKAINYVKKDCGL